MAGWQWPTMDVNGWLAMADYGCKRLAGSGLLDVNGRPAIDVNDRPAMTDYVCKRLAGNGQLWM